MSHFPFDQSDLHFLPSPLPDMIGGLAASSALLSPVVQTVLQMGFEASLVESLVQTKYLLTGRQYTSVSDLVSDVLQAEQEDREAAPQSRGIAASEVGEARFLTDISLGHGDLPISALTAEQSWKWSQSLCHSIKVEDVCDGARMTVAVVLIVWFVPSRARGEAELQCS